MSKKAFGLYDPDTVSAVNRLLKERGIKIARKSNYRQWGDQIEIWVEDLPAPETEKKKDEK